MKRMFYLSLIIVGAGAILSCNHSANTTTFTKDSLSAIHDSGVNIAYTDTGRSDTTLLFVHGWAINKSYWENQAAYFSKRYRVVAIDLPGFGLSGKNRDKWGTTEFSADVDSAIAQLGLKKVILVGHSMSGDIVLQAAIDNPDKVIGVVGVDNFKNVGEPNTEKGKKEMADAIAQMRRNYTALSAQWFNQQLFSKTTSAQIKKRILYDVAHTDSTIAVDALAQGDNFDDLAKLQQSKKKLYLINSDTSPTNTKRMEAKKLPFQVFYTKGTGHFAMVESPAEFNHYLDEIIADIRKK